jgi:hypothetical protein
MRLKIRPAILSAAAGLMFLWHAGNSGAQSILATGEDADITVEGLHRVDPSIMEAAWVKPDLDLSRFSRILVMPTAIQFRDVGDRVYDARSRIGVAEFPVEEEKKEWLRSVWRRAVDTRLALEQTYQIYDGVGSDVLVVQGFLVDVVSHIPPDSVGSSFTFVRDPWDASIVLELRDGTNAELLARTIDRRHAEGLVDAVTIWVRTEDLLERWANVLADRLEQLSDLGGARGPGAPSWAR